MTNIHWLKRNINAEESGWCDHCPVFYEMTIMTGKSGMMMTVITCWCSVLYIVLIHYSIQRKTVNDMAVWKPDLYSDAKYDGANCLSLYVTVVFLTLWGNEATAKWNEADIIVILRYLVGSR